MPHNIERRIFPGIGPVALTGIVVIGVCCAIASLPTRINLSLAHVAFAALWFVFFALLTVIQLIIVREMIRRRETERRLLREATERQRAAEMQARLLSILEATPDMVGMVDMQGKMCYINKAGRALLGLGEFEEISGASESGDSSEAERTQLQDEVFPIGLERPVWHREKVLTALDGRRIPMSQVLIAHRGPDGKIAYLSTIARDITERRRMEEQLHEQMALVEEHRAKLEAQKAALEEANARLEALATTDGLTGLKNHRTFYERLAEEFERSGRYHTPLSVMMLDVDHFKTFNDTFGHPTGDQILKRLAKILMATTRASDIVARYGGEEFVVLLPATDDYDALLTAERIRAAIAEEPWGQQAITVSIGISSLSCTTETPAHIIEEADQALYISKSRGRNCVTHHNAWRYVAVSR